MFKNIRGTLQEKTSLKAYTWFRTESFADLLYTAEDEDDLCEFMKQLPLDMPYHVVGLGSNTLFRDGGVEGVVIRLGKSFTKVEVLLQQQVRAGASTPDLMVAMGAANANIGGLEFLSGIPGAIGGALRMNGGAYERETKDIFMEARAVNRQGKIVVLKHADMGFHYRHITAPDDLIFTSALFQGFEKPAIEAKARIKEVQVTRKASQPIMEKTGGSTFKNPEGHKSWQLIDAAGCRGLRVGEAQVSEKHCNFLINHGGASAKDIETLGELVRERVKAHSGVELHWEIKRIGRF